MKTVEVRLCIVCTGRPREEPIDSLDRRYAYLTYFGDFDNPLALLTGFA
jgi:hypothetical protein